jgi:hypothetical protein
MATVNLNLQGGMDPGTGYGTWVEFDVSGIWTAGDTWKITLATDAGVVVLGAGTLSHYVPSFCFTFNQRVYLLSGSKLIGSGINDANGWELQDIGSLAIDMSNRYSNPENLISLASYQGKLVIFSRRTTQIWIMDADPNKCTVVQILDNIGTMAKRSAKSIGDMDVIFLSDTGVRSLRVRDSSLNAFVSDLGSPIDSLVLAKMSEALTPTTESACAAVEPSANRYMLFLRNVFYVLSYFPSSKVIAWSTYQPTHETDLVAGTFDMDGHIDFLVSGLDYYFDIGNATQLDVPTTPGGETDPITLTESGTFLPDSGVALTPAQLTGPAGVAFTGHVYEQTPFTVDKMIVTNGVVYLHDTDGWYYTYGPTYDHCIARVETPWLDNKKPATKKQGTNVDISMQGNWLTKAAMDYKTTPTPFKLVTEKSSPTFDPQSFPYSNNGTHFKLKSQCADALKAVLSSLIFHYTDAGERT